VVNALVMALGRRHPTAGELTHDADRRPQYTSLEFSNRMNDWKINPSFSRTGRCFDNAAMESTWTTPSPPDHHTPAEVYAAAR
jgi:transposase InsO family protein